MIVIELQRAPILDAVGEEAVCGICQQHFTTGLVLAYAHVRGYDGHGYGGVIGLGEVC